MPGASALLDKLRILTDAAKYDVACTSSGLDRKGRPGSLGSAAACGICHSFAADGRCISLLKVLMSNACAYNCSYCVNRRENDVPRATFAPRELAELTIEFYKRNYIEGLFLSSAVVKNPDYTCERMLATLRLLRMVATGGRTLSRAKLSALAHEHPRDLLEASAAWQRRLTALVEPYGFFDTASRRAQHVVLGAAIFLAVIAVAAIIWVSWRAGVLALATAAAMGVLGNYTMRRSPEGNDIAAHAKALRNWMRDGGWSLEGDKLAPDERAALIPYAYLFGALKSLGFGASADAEGADAGDAAMAVRGKAPMAAGAAPADEAAFLATLAPVFSQSLDEALRAAHKRAEVS